jgi:hypothetical protein
MVLNKEQSFLVHEFVKKYGDERVWKAQDRLYELVSEIISASAPQEEALANAN